MSNTIIHIGFHKSASTFLQKNIFPNIKVNYSFLSSGNRDILDNIENKNFDKSLFKKQLTEVMPQTINNDYDKTLLSHEELSGFPDGSNRALPYIVADNLKETYPNAKIIIIIRKQFDYIQSYYTYRVAIKGQESRKFNNFLNHANKIGLFEKLNYEKIIEYYITKFGENNVLVIPMEIVKKDTNLFVKTITDFIGVASPHIISKTIVNKSTKLLPIISFWLPINYIFDAFLKLLSFTLKPNQKYSFARIRYGFYFIKEKITSILSLVFKSSKKIDVRKYTEYEKLYNLYANSNKITQKHTQFNLKELGYPF